MPYQPPAARQEQMSALIAGIQVAKTIEQAAHETMNWAPQALVLAPPPDNPRAEELIEKAKSKASSTACLAVQQITDEALQDVQVLLAALLNPPAQ